MSKQAYRESQRVAPCGAAGIEAIQKIAQEYAAAKVNEVLIDAYSACLVSKVWASINEKNRAKLVAMPVAKVVEICYQVAA